MDDGYGMGPRDVLFPALEKFARDVEAKCLFVWEKTKTEVFSWDGVLTARTAAGTMRAGAEVDGVFEPGLICYGVPV